MGDAGKDMRTKVLLIGPCQAGKSTIANVLVEQSDGSDNHPYRPTKGVRILELEGEGRRYQSTIELWDISGDPAYSRTWPALQQDAQGVVIVYNPDDPQQAQDIERIWADRFMQPFEHMAPKQVLVVQTLMGGEHARAKLLPQKLAQFAPAAIVNSDELTTIRADFDKYLDGMLQVVMEKQHKEEDALLGDGK
mmetsp:Transcript_57402/g.123291  ORF Transcript_57402/g.123291 Transcript_57402/m.123291 type:complete len:193 (-) Transcript_57402:95-673(-)